MPFPLPAPGSAPAVGVTTNRPCFTRIIGHKSLTVHPIYTKVDTRIRRWTAFLCAKFQGDRSMRLSFIALFASLSAKTRRRRRKKNRKKKTETLAARISEMA